jgi:urea transport system ATP-binding protein
MLAADNLRVYYGESCVLKDVNIDVPEGKVVCLMGRNGVGKTTLIQTLMGSLKPRQGRIIYEGKDITHIPPHRRSRSGIGYVPQGRGIFPHLSVYENLLMGFEAIRRPGKHAIDESLTEIYELSVKERKAANSWRRASKCLHWRTSQPRLVLMGSDLPL